MSALALACARSKARSCRSIDLVEALDCWTREPSSAGGEDLAPVSELVSCSLGAGDPGGTIIEYT